MSVVFIRLAGATHDMDISALAADVRGEWVSHRNPNPNGHGWRVSHIATGRSLATLADDLTHRDAQRICRRIASAIPVLRIEVTDRRRDDGATVNDDDRRLIESIVAEVIAS
jgi:hypothetical protein